MKSCVAGLAIFASTCAIAGPFGLEMGLTYEVLNKSLALKKFDQFIYVTKTVPNSHPAFTNYMLVITPKHGLCKISASTDNIRTSVYGDELRQKFDDIESAISQKYGKGKKYDFLRVGSIWDEQRDWMMALHKEERTLREYWTTKELKLPDAIYGITLEAAAPSTGSGYIRLAYQFENGNECLEFLNSQGNPSL